MLGMMSKPEPNRSGMISKKKTSLILVSTLHSVVVQYPGRKLLTYLALLVMLVDGAVTFPGRKPDKTLESDHGSVALEVD